MIRINGIEVGNGFRGNINLGTTDKLFVTGDGTPQTLYGTLFKQSEATVIIPPSEKALLTEGTLSQFLIKTIERRTAVIGDIDRLEKVKADVVDGRYAYGVSAPLLEDLGFLTENTIKPLPSCIVGGALAYSELQKSNYEAQDFEDTWINWSHVGEGLERYQ